MIVLFVFAFISFPCACCSYARCFPVRVLNLFALVSFLCDCSVCVRVRFVSLCVLFVYAFVSRFPRACPVLVRARFVSLRVFVGFPLVSALWSCSFPCFYAVRVRLFVLACASYSRSCSFSCSVRVSTAVPHHFSSVSCEAWFPICTRSSLAG